MPQWVKWGPAARWDFIGGAVGEAVSSDVMSFSQSYSAVASLGE